MLDPAVLHADVARPLAFSTGVTLTRVNHRDDRSSPIPTSTLLLTLTRYLVYRALLFIPRACAQNSLLMDAMDVEYEPDEVAAARVAEAAGRWKELVSGFGYRVLQQLGAGAYGVVYSVQRVNELKLHPKLRYMGERGAVKVIKRHETPVHYLRKYLPRELEISQRLHHTNIVQTFLVWRGHPLNDSRDLYFFFMEISEDGDLLKFIKVHTSTTLRIVPLVVS